MTMREEAEYIIKESVRTVMPDEAVKRALAGRDFGSSRLYLIAAGKAAWQMAKAACEILGRRINKGMVCTKYGHVKGELDGIKCYEAGHPVPDENSYQAAQAAIDMVSDLTADDTVIFLLSGGASALFEKPAIEGTELADITEQLLACGADIREINIIRKRLSVVKGGRFAKLCEPAKIMNIILSDIVGDPLDMIGSGPTYPDSSLSEEATGIAKKYNLKLSERAKEFLKSEPVKELSNIETFVTGNVRGFCDAAVMTCEKLGYDTVLLTDCLDCEAREAGRMLGSIAMAHSRDNKNLAFIAGGETIVHLNGHGLGGRNQELALAAAEKIRGLRNAAVFSIGSDGTDGPTDAAGGYSDGSTVDRILEHGEHAEKMLDDNDSYHALKLSGGLIMTGPTGTNVNDIAVVLIRKQQPVNSY